MDSEQSPRSTQVKISICVSISAGRPKGLTSLSQICALNETKLRTRRVSSFKMI